MLRQEFQQYFSTYSGDPVHILVNRGGSSFYIDASLYSDKAENSDVLLVNRDGVSYQVSWANFDTVPRDTDIMLCNQGGLSHYLSVKTLKGILSVETDVIVDISTDRSTLTFDSDKSLSTFTPGLNVSQTIGGTPVTSTISTNQTLPGRWNEVPLTSLEKGDITAWSFVAYSRSRDRYVVVASGITDNATPWLVIYSDDGGLTWTRVRTMTPLNTTQNWDTIAYSPPLDIFVALGRTGDTSYMRSEDGGETWAYDSTNVGGTAGNRRNSKIIWAKDRFISVGEAGSMYSFDGQNFLTDGSLRDTLPGSSDKLNWRGIAYSEETDMVVAVAEGRQIAYSTDLGQTWTYLETGAAAEVSWYKVCYGAGRWVAVGNRYNMAGNLQTGYSDDGINWFTASDGLEDYLRLVDVTYGAGTYVAVSNSRAGGQNRIAFSTDGIKWTQSGASAGVPPDGDFLNVVYGKDRFLTVQGDTNGAHVNSALWSYTGGLDQQELTFANNTNLTNFKANDVISKGAVAQVDEASLSMRVDLDDPSVGYTDGETVTGPACTAATGVIASVDVANKQMVLSSSDESGSGRWLVTKSTYESDKVINAKVTSPSL